uniref:Uncharacterized protein n=1 Tax=Meloidogyne enterolobii TaxID=390850 RepID=A0A6V7TXU7_MELEN|nr:unnamed protein product [Meloidogyne enterolobii]
MNKLFLLLLFTIVFITIINAQMNMAEDGKDARLKRWGGMGMGPWGGGGMGMYRPWGGGMYNMYRPWGGGMGGMYRPWGMGWGRR